MGRDRLHRVCEYIDANTLAGVLSLDELAGVAGLSRFHFIQAFKRETGMTPHQYVMQSRVKLAKRLITSARMSLAEIGSAAGFGSHYHFTNYFRRVTGVTPLQFQRQI